jgi:predicted pyridoxine 5'-phosphate oxidase superfamily flavin-nucleotide-binding protein
MKEHQPGEASSTTNGMSLIAQAWENHEGPAVLVTVNAAKTPNVIYVGEIRLVPGEGFIVADNYFCKTRANIQGGTKGAILFLTQDRKSFQVKGALTYHTAGPVFEHMQTWHNPKHPGVAAARLRIEAAYCGAEKLF